jgi:hypothetical protein
LYYIYQNDDLKYVQDLYTETERILIVKKKNSIVSHCTRALRKQSSTPLYPRVAAVLEVVAVPGLDGDDSTTDAFVFLSNKFVQFLANFSQLVSDLYQVLVVSRIMRRYGVIQELIFKSEACTCGHSSCRYRAPTIHPHGPLEPFFISSVFLSQKMWGLTEI